MFGVPSRFCFAGIIEVKILIYFRKSNSLGNVLDLASLLGKDLWTSSLSQKAKLLSLVAAEC